MYHVGEYVVYGMNGVCKVEQIGTMDLSGIDGDKLYYTLAPLYTKGNRVFTPVDNCKVIMRPILTKTEVLNLIDDSIDIDLIQAEHDKSREIAYKESLRSCDCKEWIRIIRTAMKRKADRLAAGKKMAACDERYLKQAKENLYGEFAVSLQIDKAEVEEYISQRISIKKMASAS